MELTDILSKDGWKELAEEINKRFGMNGSVNDKHGLLVAASPALANKICPSIKAGEQSRAVCATAHKHLAQQAQETREIAVGECDAGFTKFVVPIFYKDEFLGTAGGCGFLADNGRVDAFYVAKLLNLNEEEVNDWTANIKKLSRSDLQAAMEYVKGRLQEILRDYKG
jgi:ligand-binding sensor protein